MFQRAVCLLTLICANIEAARILAVFPTPSISHQVVFRPLTQALASRGHEVVVITPDPAFQKGQAPDNLTEIDVHDVSYEDWSKNIKTSDRNGDESIFNKQVNHISLSCLAAFEKQADVAEVKDIIQNKNITFDLLLVEAYLRFTLGYSHNIKAPVIAVSSFGTFFDNYNVMGAPVHHLLYPEAINTRFYNLSIWGKIMQYYKAFYLLNDYKKAEKRENVVVRRIFGENTPSLSELQNNIEMLFINMHPLWEGNRPVPPGVLHIGGLPEKPEMELPEDLQEYLDDSVHGVIYLSFGTNVEASMLPADKIQCIINVFSRLPYDVLWKWNQRELPGRTKNIRISKWFPQSDLLRHPKVKLFIYQGGLQSTDETIKAGVPTIGIPMLGDQWYQTEKMEHQKIGKRIYLDELNEEVLEVAIRTVIEDKSYRENVVRLRTLMADQPMTSLQRAVWWTEHAVRRGGARRLRAPAHNMPWHEYYELHLVLVLLAIVFTVIIIVFFLFYKVIKTVIKFFVSKSKSKMS